MNTAIESEEWRSIDSIEKMQKRTYKSGAVRYYTKGYRKWYRLDECMALHWLKQKYFVKQAEYKIIKEEESKDTMRKLWLRIGQKLGGFDWVKHRVDKE